jgi:hypothetical protein
MRYLLPAALAVVLLTTVYAGTASSQETLFPDYFNKGKPILLHGQGSRSCGTFIADKNTPQTGVHAQDMAWVLGFLHGVDSWNPYSIKNYEYNGLNLWLEEYCKRHPLEMLANAANDFYREIGGRAPMTEDYTIWQHLRRP